LKTTVFVPRLRAPFFGGTEVIETLKQPFRDLPMRLTQRLARNSLDRAFIAALNAADPARTVAYFWPDVPIRVVRKAKSRGVLAVREMINNPVAAAKPILDAAYARFGVNPIHNATDAKVAHEAEELPLYHRIFASNAEVEKSLQRLGIDASRIEPTSFGWRPERYTHSPPRASGERRDTIRALFVGTIEIRKGVPELLAAWDRAAVDGVLLLAGAVAPELKTLVQRHVATGRVAHLGFVEDMGALYRSVDFFVFPSLEEGGPQVTIEAGGCGLPVITTPMGAARFVEDGATGLIVPPADVGALAQAIGRLAGSAADRERMGSEGKVRALNFTYRILGEKRARMFNRELAFRAAKEGGPEDADQRIRA